MRSFLMIGQSNMAGRGVIGEMPPIENEHVFAFQENCWIRAKEPVNPNRFYSGESPQLAFADMVQRAVGGDVGLIPCAEGGTLLRQWQEGGELFLRTVSATREAMKTSCLSSILWVQGENEGFSLDNASSYAVHFLRFLDALIAAIPCSNELPILVAELPQHLDQWNDQVEPEKQVPYFRTVSEQLLALPTMRENIHCIRTQGLSMKADGIHYDTPSLRKLGHRFAELWLETEHLKGRNMNHECGE